MKPLPCTLIAVEMGLPQKDKLEFLSSGWIKCPVFLSLVLYSEAFCINQFISVVIKVS